MNKGKIKEYLKRVEELELKLIDEDRETLSWLIYGYNQCAKLLNETEQENIQLKTQLLEKKCSDKDIEYKEKIKLQQRIDKVIEYINDFPLIHYSSVEKVNEKRLSGKLVPIDDLLGNIKR